MKKIVDFLRKIGVLHVSKGDYQSGEFDDRKDLKDQDGAEKNDGPFGKKDEGVK